MTVNEYRSYIKRNLEIERGNVLEAWADGAYTGRETAETIQLNARALGFVEALNTIIEYLDVDMIGENE